jgi:hypothetical protein
MMRQRERIFSRYAQFSGNTKLADVRTVRTARLLVWILIPFQSFALLLVANCGKVLYAQDCAIIQ